MNTSYPDVEVARDDEKLHRRQMAEKINQLNQGKFNGVSQVTLTPSATSTALIDTRIGANSFIGLQATTASAAAASPSIYIDTQQKGQAVMHHPSNAATDQTFNVVIIG